MDMYPIQAKFFCDLLKKRQKATVDIIDGLKTQKIINASFLSNKIRKTVKIKT